jgi:hypothetical protein
MVVSMIGSWILLPCGNYIQILLRQELNASIFVAMRQFTKKHSGACYENCCRPKNQDRIIGKYFDRPAIVDNT